MLPGKDGRVRVRANLDGEVEIRAEVGQTVIPRQLIAVVEGDTQIESLSVRKTSVVVEILIESGTEEIQCIAAAVGIDDRNYFSRWFRRQTGLSPTEWRRQGAH